MKPTPRPPVRHAPMVVEPLERRALLSATMPVASDLLAPMAGSQPVGSLTGKVVYLSGGHGYAYSNGRWNTGRGNNNGVVEDFGNQDQLQPYADYVLRSGGTVAALRPIGHQTNEVVLDNDDAAVTYSGAWNNSSAGVFYGSAGDVPYRFAGVDSTETATATYRPNLPAEGFYPVYTWVRDGTDRTNQLYRVRHSGGETDVRVNHRNVGKGWVYLGSYHFDAGTGGSVVVSNESDGATPGSVVIADAIRFGNGMGDVVRGGRVSGQSREDESALYWLEAAVGQGTSFSQFAVGSTDENSNVGAPPRYAAFMNAAPFGTSVYLGFHSNAGGGRGGDGLYNRTDLFPGTATTNQFAWANLVGSEINGDLRALTTAPGNRFEHAWANRGSNNTFARTDYAFGEIRRNAINNEMDATIMEVAYHDDVTDADLLLDPKVRDAVGRSAAQATVKYFNQFGGAPATLAPVAPTGARATTSAAGDVTVRWTPTAVNPVTGDAPTGYVVEVSRDGRGFAPLATVNGGSASSFTVAAGQLDGDAYYFRVVAANAGGQSPATAVVGARKSGAAGRKLLVVNAFDRLDRFLDPNLIQSLNYAPPPPATRLAGPGENGVVRVRPREENSFDYVAQAGETIERYAGSGGAGGAIGFDAVGSAAVASGAVDLADYDGIVWLNGEESTGDDTFSAAEQQKVAAYVSAGGKIFASGAEIGWDLVRNNNGASFYANTLKATYVSDDAGTHAVAGVGGSIFAGLALSFDDGSQFYNAEFPDVISAPAGSTLALTYVGGTGGGAAVQSASGASRVVTAGFPFETITTAADRAAVMSRVLDYFGLAAPVAPVAPPTPAAPTLLASSDTGASSSDRLTNDDTPTFAGTASAGALVRLYAAGTLVGSATAGASGAYAVTASAVADGARAFTVTAAFPNGPASSASASTVVTIDTAAPTVLATGYEDETRRGVAVRFSEPIDPASFSANDFAATNVATGAAVSTTATYDAAGRAGFFALPASTADGNYRAGMIQSASADLAGNRLSVPAGAAGSASFFVLGGDYNHDRVVNATDLLVVLSHFGRVGGPAKGVTFSIGDGDYDGFVGRADYLMVLSRYGKSLAPPSAASTTAELPAARPRVIRAPRRAATLAGLVDG